MENKPKKTITKKKTSGNQSTTITATSTLLQFYAKHTQEMKKLAKPVQSPASRKHEPHDSELEVDTDIDVENDEVGQAINDHLTTGTMQLPDKFCEKAANITETNQETTSDAASRATTSKPQPRTPTPNRNLFPDELNETATQQEASGKSNQTTEPEPFQLPGFQLPQPEQDDNESIISISSSISSSTQNTAALNPDMRKILKELGVSATICQKIAETMAANYSENEEDNNNAKGGTHTDENTAPASGKSDPKPRAKKQIRGGSSSKGHRPATPSASASTSTRPTLPTCNCSSTRKILMENTEKLASMLEVVATKLENMAADTKITNIITKPIPNKSSMLSDEDE
nr:nucleolar protein dao-5-like isoform X2 [Drosophila kikkawai]XP_041630691.1 nucleolar protein dao-5-like isoform X2 [Drosophila kikkawai]XP_041630823.1 nucleolar protein dao-5-like isoform X2 [Drosophila kikkawai]